MSKKHSSAAGFSLLEVLIALLMLSLGILMLVALQLSLMVQLSDSETKMQAIRLASNSAELLLVAGGATENLAVVHRDTPPTIKVHRVADEMGQRIEVDWLVRADIARGRDGHFTLWTLP